MQLRIALFTVSKRHRVRYWWTIRLYLGGGFADGGGVLQRSRKTPIRSRALALAVCRCAEVWHWKTRVRRN